MGKRQQQQDSTNNNLEIDIFAKNSKGNSPFFVAMLCVGIKADFLFSFTYPFCGKSIANFVEVCKTTKSAYVNRTFMFGTKSFPKVKRKQLEKNVKKHLLTSFVGLFPASFTSSNKTAAKGFS